MFSFTLQLVYSPLKSLRNPCNIMLGPRLLHKGVERKVNRCRNRATIVQFVVISLVTDIWLTITGFEEQAFVILHRDASDSMSPFLHPDFAVCMLGYSLHHFAGIVYLNVKRTD